MNPLRWLLACVLSFVAALAMVAELSSEALARPRQHGAQQHPASVQRPHAKKAATKAAARHRPELAHKQERKRKPSEASRSAVAAPVSAAAEAPASPPLSGDLAAVKSVFELTRKGKTSDASAVAKTIEDPAARKLVEWFMLRHSESMANFSRYAAFIRDNPAWPNVSLMRRRAEACLWQQKSDAATVRDFIGDRPASAKGRLALARVLLAEGDADAAARWVRKVWQSEDLSERTEADVIEGFGALLASEDHRARMDRRLGAKDFSGAMRAAHRLGGDEVSIVKACLAVKGDEKKAPGLLDDVPAAARSDLGYVLCRIQWLMRHDRIADATQLMLTAPRATMALQDTDEWWRSRRVLARKLLDLGQFKEAYQVARQAAPPQNEYYRAEWHFLAGWIALRYLNEPETARAHFVHVDEGSVNPIVLARANYWRGRAAEEIGDAEAMHAAYQAAARYSTAYYGQLARAKLGLDGVELRAPQAGPDDDAAPADERVRAAEMLYRLNEQNVVLSFVTDLAEQSTDVPALVALGALAGRHNDARAMLQIGKTALARGLAMDHFAFPTIGIPEHKPIGLAIDSSVIYSVARTESAFDQRDRSSANAVGLMQVTPEAGRDTAKRFGVGYDWDRLVSDPVYNTQMGAAELSALLREYKGSHIMTFAAYNAGRGRVQDWVKQHGDPRDPAVDPVDWVERIPFAETRNYVQRVIENVQVYRARFEAIEVAKRDQEQSTVARAAGSGMVSSAQALPPP
ncbi:lytic transglycosylase domain-containing protein [Bradyrhizobium sp. SZCCHNR1070]|uniref:lytic transglycosylase domain-containing protein n=1 Tax=Bradyrhizobium sp. SZCCHNR1070 TaxID=3057361 RepID=UPI002916B1FE|nr:lytic transglycosylase domain-containing protein [Bradyrhizobium sp. SZCCHNR1070]